MGWFVLTGIAIVAVIGLIAFGRTAAVAERRLMALGGSALVGVVWLGITLLMSLHTVENGHIGIVKQFGSIVGTTGEGLVTTAPWRQLSAVSVRNEIRTYAMDDRTVGGSGSAISRDSQPVFLTVQVNYSLVRVGAVDLYRETGGQYVERILDPAAFQITKEVTARYKAIEFAANREGIRAAIEKALQLEVGKVTGVTGASLDALRINNVSLKNVDFTDALSQAIEQTVEAEQQAKREEAKVRIAEAVAKQKVAEAEGDAKSNVTRATGEAKANRLRQQSLTPLLVQQQAIEKMNPNVQVIVCPPRTVCIPNTTTPVETGP
ncbi:MAG: prohibitin family protein [Actinobacteria bacterium]|nr:prohibitin family protein [Actinomycetota bacterium]